MKTSKIKKVLCLVMVLLLAVGWYQVNVCRAEEVKQSIPEGTTKGGNNSSPEISAEQNLAPAAIGIQIVCMLTTKETYRCIGR